MLSVSANGAKRGTGIVWASLARQGDPGGPPIPGALRAFNAEDLSQELWSSEDDAGRDGVPLFAKFCPPTIANGKVFLPTFSGQLLVYGLLASAVPDAVNAGGPAAGAFKADSGFTGGGTVSAPAALTIDTAGVAGAAPPDVYRTARQGNFTYTRSGLTPYARYTLRLHVADVTNGRLPRSGVMNVLVNGVRALSDFSVPPASRGTARAVVRTFVFNAPADGTVSLVFRAGHLGAASASSLAPAAALGPGGQGASAPSSRAILPSLGGCLVSGIEIVPGAGS
jgi:hypothetical protein